MTADLLDQQDVRRHRWRVMARRIAGSSPAINLRWPRTCGALRGIAASVKNWCKRDVCRGILELGELSGPFAVVALAAENRHPGRLPFLEDPGEAANAAGMSAEAWQRAAETPREAEAAEAAEAVHVMLARLAPRDRLVLTLLYLEQCSVAEAAGLCGWTQTMVKVQAYRAKETLPETVGSGGGEAMNHWQQFETLATRARDETGPANRCDRPR